MANEFIIRKGYKSLASSEITGSLNVSGNIYGERVYVQGKKALDSSANFLYIDPNTQFGSGIYINNAVRIDGGLLGSYNEDLQLRTGTTTRITIANADGAVRFHNYSAGYLKTDSSGNITVDTSTIEDTLQSVTDRGSTSNNLITLTRNAEQLRMNTADANGPFASFKKNGTNIGFIGSGYHLWSSPNNNSDNIGFRGENQIDFGIGASVKMTINSSGNTTFAGDITSAGTIIGAADFKATGNNLKLHAGGNHILSIDLNGKIYPSSDAAKDLGFSTSAYRFRHGYFSGNVYAGNFHGDGSNITGVTAEWDGSHTGNASITGNLTIGGNITVDNPLNYLFNLASNALITPSYTHAVSTPFGSPWHDTLAFQRNYTVSQETSTDNSSWTSVTTTAGLFVQKDKTSHTVIANGVRSVRWTFTGVAYNVARFIHIAAGYSSPTPTCAVTIEYSSDNTNWTTIHTSTGVSFSASNRYYTVNPYIGNGGRNYCRITIDKGSTDTKVVRLAGIKMLTQRLGDQGKGREDELPFLWDDNKKITLEGGATTNSNSTVISSRKFTARDSNGTGLFADDASSGLSIADNGNATFTRDVTIDGSFKWATTNATSFTYSNADASGLYIETVGSTAALSDMRFQARAAGTGNYSSIKIKPSNQSIVLNTNGTTALTLDTSQDATFTGNVSMPTGNSTGKFAVMSTAVHGSYDFYNNGTSYFNGAVSIDNNLDITIGAGDVGLLVKTTDASTTPNVRFGRNSGEYVGFKVEDRANRIVFRQDETTGNHESIFDIWSSTTGNKAFLFNASDNAGSNSVNWLTIENGDASFTGDVTVAGTLTAQEFHTEFISASVIYESGSTKFGDTSDDNHDFTGSVNIVGATKFQKGASDQNTSADSGTIPSTTGAEFLRIAGGYTNGQYTHEWTKVDRTGNLPLYLRESKGTANSFTNIARFGDHAYASGITFEVFGKARATHFYGDGSNLTNLPTQTDNTRVAKVGDTMTGNLTISKDNSKIVIDSNNSGQASVDINNSSLSARWILDSDDLLRVYNQTSSFDTFAIKSSGFVGVGTATPGGIFEVFKSGTGRTRGDFLVDEAGKYTIVGRLSTTSGDVSSFKVRDRLNRAYFDVNTASKYISFNPEVGDITMQIASGYGFKVNTNQLVVDATNDRVGIGTATPASNLHIYDTVGATVTTDMLKLEAYTGDFGATPAAIALAFKFQDSNNATNEARIRMATVNDTDYGDNDEAASNLIFSTTNAGTESDKVIITGRGAVGFGTNNPLKHLHIKSGNFDQLLIENGTASGTAGIQFKANSNRNAGPFIKATQRGGAASDSDLQLGDESGTILTLNASNVGIGTTSPGAKLDVAGDATFAGAIRITETGTAQHILIGNQDSSGANKPAMIRGVNGELKLGYGNSWTGEGGTMTIGLTLDTSSNATFEGNVTIDGDLSVTGTVPTWNQNTTGTATTASNAMLLDGIDSTSFLRSDAADTATQLTVDTLIIGSAAKIQFQNNDFIRYEDGTGVGRFHFDADGGTNNASVQAATFVGALSGNATSATTATTATRVTINSDFSGTYPMLVEVESSGDIYNNPSVTYNGTSDTLTSPNFSGNLTGDVTGDVTGNADTVTNGVYTTGNQTIAGTKNFSGVLEASGTVKNVLSQHYVEIYIYGDDDKYYPVTIAGATSHYGYQKYHVSRRYNWTAPSTWNTSTHMGALSLTWEHGSDTAWGGNDKEWRVIQFDEVYSTVCNGMVLPVTEGMVVWLRGGGTGGARYRVSTPQGAGATVKIYDNKTSGASGNGTHVASTTFTAGDGNTYAAESYSSANVDSRIKEYWPIRGKTNHFRGQHQIYAAIDEDNFASNSATRVPTQQSTKAYISSFVPTTATTASNAMLLDGIDSTGFVAVGGDTMTGALTLAPASGLNSVLNLNGDQDSFLEKDTGNTLYIANNANNQDIKFRVKDNSTNVIALTLDGSENGNATFSGNVTVSSGKFQLTVNAPTNLVTSIVNDTINVTFTASTTTNIDNYLVFSSVAGGDYGLISVIPPADFGATMSIIDDSFNAGGTQAYRIYAVKNGVYSTALTGTKSFTVGTVEPTNLSVVNLNTAFYIQYDAPSSKGRFVTAYNIYKHEHATQSSLDRSSATLIYSGMNNSYMYQISGNNNNFHQFWVETTVA